jgi:hypothetical protein
VYVLSESVSGTIIPAKLAACLTHLIIHVLIVLVILTGMWTDELGRESGEFQRVHSGIVGDLTIRSDANQKSVVDQNYLRVSSEYTLDVIEAVPRRVAQQCCTVMW